MNMLCPGCLNNLQVSRSSAKIHSLKRADILGVMKQTAGSMLVEVIVSGPSNEHICREF